LGFVAFCLADDSQESLSLLLCQAFGLDCFILQAGRVVPPVDVLTEKTVQAVKRMSEGPGGFEFNVGNVGGMFFECVLHSKNMLLSPFKFADFAM
jgi:hypothetical protein